MKPLLMPLVVDLLRTPVPQPRLEDGRGTTDCPVKACGWVVPRQAPSAGLIRQGLRKALTRWDVTEDAADDVVLVCSELVGNAVEHTTGAWVRVVTCRHPGIVAVAVLDQGPSPAERLRVRPACDEALRGRGLRIVDEIAAWWDSRRVGQGTLVRAVLTVPADATAAITAVEPSLGSPQ